MRFEIIWEVNASIKRQIEADSMAEAGRIAEELVNKKADLNEIDEAYLGSVFDICPIPESTPNV